MMDLSIPEYDIKITEKSDGLMISQNGKTYLAKKWTLSRDVDSVIRAAVKAGFDKLWVNGHPRRETAHYVCFARLHDEKWDFLIASEGLKRVNREATIKFFTVNKCHAATLKSANIPFNTQNWGGGHLEVKPLHLNNLLNVL